MLTSIYPDLSGRVVRLPNTFKGAPKRQRCEGERPHNVVPIRFRRIVYQPKIEPALLIILALIEAIDERDLAARKGKRPPRPIWTCISGAVGELLQESRHHLPSISTDLEAALNVVLAKGSRPLHDLIITRLREELTHD